MMQLLLLAAIGSAIGYTLRALLKPNRKDGPKPKS